MKTTFLLWCAFSVLGLGAESENVGRNGDATKPQVIQLGDDTTLRFLGVTHGKRHVAPQYENLHTGNWIHTPGDATVAWIEAAHGPKRRPSYQLLVSDKALTGRVPVEQRTWSHVRNGLGVQGFVLNAFPRWDKETVLRVRLFHAAIVPGQFVCTNTPPDPVANWNSEPLPITKRNGDLEVTVTNLSMGALQPYWRGRPAPEDDPANHCVRIGFGVRENGQPTTNWHAGWCARLIQPTIRLAARFLIILKVASTIPPSLASPSFQKWMDISFNPAFGLTTHPGKYG